MINSENDGEGEPGVDGEKKKRQTRGGRGVVKVKQKQDVEKRICLSRACRGKRKFVTVITGLATYGELGRSDDLRLGSMANCRRPFL